MPPVEKPIVTVNRRLWARLLDLQRSWTQHVATVVLIKEKNNTLVQSVTQDIDRAIDALKLKIRDLKIYEDILFHGNMILYLLIAKDGTSPANERMVWDLISNQRKLVNPFPYIDKSLILADFEDPMWNDVDKSPGIFPVDQATIDRLKSKLRDLIESDKYNQPTDKEITWVRQHAQWYYDQHKDHDYDGTLPIRSRIEAMELSISARIARSDTYYEKDSDEDSDTEPFSEHKAYEALSIVDAADEKQPQVVTRGTAKRQARKIPTPTTLSDLESDDDSDVNMDKLKGGRLAARQSSDAA